MRRGEYVAALGDPGDAALGAGVGGEAGDVLALPVDGACRDGVGAGDGAEEAGLADAVAAEEAGDPADVDVDGDLPKRDGGAVKEVDVGDP